MKALVLFVTVAIATPALAQGRGETASRLIISERAVAMGMAAHPPAPAVQSSSRDSVVNGTIIGALVGAAVLGTIGTTFCVLLKEQGEPSCWNSFAKTSAMGAAIGAAAGLGIDALAAQQPRLPRPGELQPPQFLRRQDD